MELNDERFMVKRHMRYVEIYCIFEKWNNMEVKEVSEIKEHIAPLVKTKCASCTISASTNEQLAYM